MVTLTHLLWPLAILVVVVNSEHFKTCRLCGDPHFHGWDQEMTGNAPWPCLFRMAKTQRFQLEPNTTAEAEVRTQSALQTIKGRYFIDCLIIIIWIYDGAGNLVALLIYQLYFIDLKLWPVQPWILPNEHNDHTDRIIVSTDPSAGTGSLYVKHESGTGNSMEVHFKIPVSGSEYRCLKVKLSHEAQPPYPEALFPYTLCSTWNDTNWGDGSQEVDLSDCTNQQIILYGLLQQDVNQTEAVCAEALKAAGECETNQDLKDAVAACDHFLNKDEVKSLELDNNGNTGDAVRAFYDCIRDECNSNKLTTLPQDGPTTEIIEIPPTTRRP